MLGKQAKILSNSQQSAVISYLAGRRHPERNILMFLFSVDAGLRAKEVAQIEWSMVTDAAGNVTDEIRLQDKASKGASGGLVYMSKRLNAALQTYSESQEKTGAIIKSQTGTQMSAQVVTNWFFKLYLSLGYEGCSSHSGRKTAITKWARKISSVGGSLRDVQALARHKSLQMTEKYIMVSEDACKKVVG